MHTDIINRNDGANFPAVYGVFMHQQMMPYALYSTLNLCLPLFYDVTTLLLLRNRLAGNNFGW